MLVVEVTARAWSTTESGPSHDLGGSVSSNANPLSRAHLPSTAPSYFSLDTDIEGWACYALRNRYLGHPRGSAPGSIHHILEGTGLHVVPIPGTQNETQIVSTHPALNPWQEANPR